MRKENNDCIRYLMKEMDPSEELLMERAMMEDEDLLIEVESMRQTLQKLDGLPKIAPSQEVQNNVLAEATRYAEQRNSTFAYLKPFYKYAAAAVLLLTFAAGGGWWYFSQSIRTNQNTLSVPTPAQISNNSEQLQFSRSSVQSASEAQNRVKPWVDRNNIMRFTGTSNQNDGNYNAILKKSAQKLQLIDQPANTSHPIESIQLTGSHK